MLFSLPLLCLSLHPFCASGNWKNVASCPVSGSCHRVRLLHAKEDDGLLRRKRGERGRGEGRRTWRCRGGERGSRAAEIGMMGWRGARQSILYWSRYLSQRFSKGRVDSTCFRTEVWQGQQFEGSFRNDLIRIRGGMHINFLTPWDTVFVTACSLIFWSNVNNQTVCSYCCLLHV